MAGERGSGKQGQGDSRSQCPDDTNAHPAQNTTLRRPKIDIGTTVRTVRQSSKGASVPPVLSSRRPRSTAHATPPMTIRSTPIATAAGQYHTGPRPAGRRRSPDAVLVVDDVPRSHPDAAGRVHVAGPDASTHDQGETTVCTRSRWSCPSKTRPRQSRTR